MTNRDQDSKRNNPQQSQSDLNKAPQKQEKSGGFKDWSSNKGSV